MRETPSAEVRIRSQSLIAFWVGLFIGATCILAAFHEQGEGGHPARIAAIAGFGILFAAGCFRLARCGVYVYDWGVRIMNPLRSRRLPWEEIRTFTLRRWGVTPFPVGHAELTDGSAVHIWAIQTPNPMLRPDYPHAATCLEELNGWLEAWGESRLPDPPIGERGP